jgi:Uma2 family endonuclease
MGEALVISKYEIERGKPLPSKNHAIIQKRLLTTLDAAYGRRYEVLPELSIDFPIRDRVPDLAFYQNITFTPGQDEITMSEMPLGLVEILSPTQNLSDLMAKCREYFTAGVQSYWLVIPDLQTIYVYYSTEDFEIFAKKETLTDKKLGIELNLSEIFK